MRRDQPAHDLDHLSAAGGSTPPRLTRCRARPKEGRGPANGHRMIDPVVGAGGGGVKGVELALPAVSALVEA